VRFVLVVSVSQSATGAGIVALVVVSVVVVSVVVLVGSTSTGVVVEEIYGKSGGRRRV